MKILSLETNNHILASEPTAKLLALMQFVKRLVKVFFIIQSFILQKND
jgi:hypothetical protein